MNPVTRFITVALSAVSLLILAALMDGPSELEAEQDIADYKSAVADGGLSVCAEFGRVPSWTKAGDLVCRLSLPVVAQGSK